MTTHRDPNIDIREQFALLDDQVAARALSELLKQHEAAIQATCRRFTGGRQQDCEDLYQEFAVKLMKHRSQFDPARDWLAWAKALLRNLAIDRLAKERTRKQHVQLDQDQVLGKVGSDQAVDYQTMIDDMKIDTDECVKRLAKEARMQMLLRDVHGMTFQGIAEAFRLSGPSRAKTLCDQARKEVRQCLEGKGWGAEDLNNK